MKNHSLYLNLLITAMAPAIWGSTYLVTTEFLPPERPLLAAVIRALPAGLVLIALGRKLPSGSWWFRSLILGALNIGAFFYFLFVAAYHLPGGVAAFLMSFQPLLVLLLGTVLLKESVQRIQLIACATGAFGVALLVIGPQADLSVVGILAGLAGAASMATGVVLNKRWGRPEGVGMFNFTGWQLTSGGLLLLPVAMLNEDLPNHITVENILGYTYLSVIGALLAYFLWFRGIERLPAVSTSFLGLASPLSATLLGFLILDEHLTPLQVVGAGAVVLAIFLARPRQHGATRTSTEYQPSSVKP